MSLSRLRLVLAGLPMPQVGDGRLVLAVDISHWLRPDAPTGPDRLFCHVYGRSGRSSDQFIPGWPYSFVAALESGRTSWCQLLDAVRLGPDDDVAEVTAAQVRRVIVDLIEMGRWHVGDRDILVIFDAGYDAPRMAHLLAGLPVEVLGRMRTDRVMRKPVPAPWISPPQGGRPPKHGKEFRFAKPVTWGEPDTATAQVTTGTAPPEQWLGTASTPADHSLRLDRPHRRPPHHRGTLIRVQVDRLPGGSDPLPVWLWSSATGLTGESADVRWQAFLRRFDLEHTFRLMKQTLGWTRPKLRTPEAGDRWTWLVIAAHTQLRLTREARRISAALGRGQPSPHGSPRPVSAEGFGTSAHTCAVRPVRRNPQHPDRAGHLVPRIAVPRPAMTSGRRPDDPRASLSATASEVKKRAESPSLNLC